MKFLKEIGFQIFHAIFHLQNKSKGAATSKLTYFLAKWNRSDIVFLLFHRSKRLRECIYLCFCPYTANSVPNSGTQQDHMMSPAYSLDDGICPAAELPPAQANLILSDHQANLMCFGTKVNYTCDAGGVNVRSVVTH